MCRFISSTICGVHMKAIKKVVSVTSIVIGLIFANQAIADTASVSVSGNVGGICKISRTVDADFATLDPSSPGPAQASFDVFYKCTNGTVVTSLTIDGAANTSSATVSLTNQAGSQTMPAYLSWTDQANTIGQGFRSTTNPFHISGAAQILEADKQNAYAGTYSKTLTVTLNP